MDLPVDVRIKENSLRAKLAAKKLISSHVAIVFGRTIYLHGVSQKDFLSDEAWVKHELQHVLQFRQHGFVLFLLKYFFEWIKNGYQDNRFEIEARKAEKES